MSDTFVNVPNLPGVPTVNFSPFLNPLAITTLLISDLVTQFSAVFGPQWGIFLDGFPVVAAESVESFEYRKDYTISDYPLEGGIFETYDKVEAPFIAKVRFKQGGSIAQRQNFLFSLQNIIGDYNFYDVVTPEVIYLNANLTHMDYHRTAINGVGLIHVDVWLSQIRVSVIPGLSANQVQSPSAGDPANGGQNQGATFSPSQLQSFPSASLGAFG
jgi:hypothetical protein